MNPMNKPNKPAQPQGVVAPPPQPKKVIPTLSGFIAVIRVDDDGITLLPTMPSKPSMNMYALSFDKLYSIDLDEKSVEGTNPRKKEKPYAAREKKKQGWFSKKKPVQTSLNTLFVVEQYHKDLSEMMYVTFTKNRQAANAIIKEADASEKHIEARTSNNKRAIMKGAGKFALALNMVKNQAKNIGSALKAPMKEMGKDIAKEEVQKRMTGGKFPDLIGDAKKLVKFAFYLPVNGYKAIQNKAKDLYKAMKGGDLKKAQKCCNDIQKMCAKKCNKKQKGGCACKGKCHCKKPGQCGGAFDIHSKDNQEFGKALEKKFKSKENKLKKEIEAIKKFKAQLKKLPAKEFDNKLKSKKHMSNAEKKKQMVDRQDKKIAAKKQAIKKWNHEVYGMFR
jgi:hypothetical protein